MVSMCSKDCHEILEESVDKSMQNETVPGTQYELYTRLLIGTSAICPLDALCPLFSQTARHIRRTLRQPI